MHPIASTSTARAATLLLGALALAGQAFAQQGAPTTLYSVLGAPGEGRLGDSITRAGDIDGDGFGDFAVARPDFNNKDGVVELRSGRDCRVLRRIFGSGGEQFGATIATLGDLDGDGLPELLVGSPLAERRQMGRVSRIDVLSSRDYSVMREIYGLGDGDRFGSSAAALGDLDGDGIREFAVGAPENGNAATSYGPGYAQVFSGADFRELRFHDGAVEGDEFGSAIASVGDIDGDGVEDYMIGALLEVLRSSGQGSARLYSGATGQVLHTWFAPAGTDHFGLKLGSLGDRDGDGDIELYVSSIGMTSPDTGGLHVYNARSGELIQRVWADGNSGVFGRSVLRVGDLTGDGIDDLVVGDPGARRNGTRFGAYHLVSGTTLTIVDTLWGEPGNAGFGRAVTRLDDLDGDGRPELGVAYPGLPLADGSRVWRADILTFATDVATPGRGCSSGPSAPRLDSTGARVGSSVPLWVGGGTQIAGSGVVLASPRPVLPLGFGGCALYLDPSLTATVAAVSTNDSGRWLGWMAIPGDPALAGAQIALQAAILPANGSLELTQGLYLRIQD